LQNGGSSKKRPFFAYNSGTVRHTAMKFDTDVLRKVPQQYSRTTNESDLQYERHLEKQATEERTILSYITAAIFANGDRSCFFAYNSGTLRHAGMKVNTYVP
jgi:hypothetical protein